MRLVFAEIGGSNTVRFAAYYNSKVFLVIMCARDFFGFFRLSLVYGQANILASYQLILADNEYWEMILSRTICYV